MAMVPTQGTDESADWDGSPPTVTVEDDRPSAPGVGLRVMSTTEFERWSPVVRRHAIVLVERAEEGPGRVAELCVAGFHALIDALAVADRVAPEVESDRYLAGRLLQAMTQHQLGGSDELADAELASQRVARAIADVAPHFLAPSVTRRAIVLRLGLSMERYEETLLQIADAGLARIDLGAILAERGSDGDLTAPLDLVEAIDALDDDARTLLSLLHEYDCSLAEAAAALGWTTRDATVAHVEIVHRLRVAMGRG